MIYKISIKKVLGNSEQVAKVKPVKIPMTQIPDWKKKIKDSINLMDDSVFIKKFLVNYPDNVLFIGMEERFEQINNVAEEWNNSFEKLRTFNIRRFEKFYKTLEINSAEELKSAIKLYKDVLTDDKCYYTYKFNVDRFIEPNSGKFEGFVDTTKENFISFEHKKSGNNYSGSKGILTHENRANQSDEDYEAEMKKFDGKDW
jgi:hypothetical protein